MAVPRSPGLQRERQCCTEMQYFWKIMDRCPAANERATSISNIFL
jgi:hypothetical protein